ncbi:MAG TPA: hypothetical protein VGN26_19620 [Armatimonadota bacterium]|jgi:hypothetical protein
MTGVTRSKLALGLRGAALLAVLGASALPASAQTTETRLYATGGEVKVWILDSYSGYNDVMSLVLPGPEQGIGIDNTITGPAGISLGTFAAGQELVFKIASGDGHTYLSGLGSANWDGKGHAYVEPQSDGSFIVNFEDQGLPQLRGGVWRDSPTQSPGAANECVEPDFNDARIRVTGVSTPDGGGLGLALLGLLGPALAAVSRRGRRA